MLENKEFIQKASVIYAQTYMQKYHVQPAIDLAQEAYTFAERLCGLIDGKIEDNSKEMLISKLCLNVRSSNCLRNKKCHTVYDLLKIGRNGLQETRNLGTKSIIQIEKALKYRGYELTERGIE